MDASTGVGLWGQRYTGTANLSEHGPAAIVSPDGSKVFVTGQSYRIASGYDYATIGINATTGGKLWVRRFNGVGNSSDYGQAVAVSPDGSKVYVTGYSYGNGTGYDYLTMALNSATGLPVGGQFDNGPGTGSDYA